MDDEPPSRSVEIDILKAFLMSRDEKEFSENVNTALESFSALVEDITGVRGKAPKITPVKTWDEAPSGDMRYWLPLSEIDMRKGVQYVYSPAIKDTIKSPKLGPFYMVSWELLLGTALVTLKTRAPKSPSATLFAGAITATTLVFSGVENEMSAAEYLDKLQTTASTLLNDTLKNTEWENNERTDFYLRTAYQLTFDAISLWTAITIKTVTFGLVDEKTVAREIADFLLKDPEVNVGIFHVRGADIARLIDYNRGKDLAEMAFQVTDAVLMASSYPRLDEMDSWKMFR